jgi:hypothetical protein
MKIQTHADACRLGWMIYFANAIYYNESIDFSSFIDLCMNEIGKFIPENSFGKQYIKYSVLENYDYYGLPARKINIKNYVRTMKSFGLCRFEIKKKTYLCCTSLTRLLAQAYSRRIGSETVQNIVNLSNYPPGVMMIFYNLLLKDALYVAILKILQGKHSLGIKKIKRVELLRELGYDFKKNYGVFRHKIEPRLWFMNDLELIQIGRDDRVNTFYVLHESLNHSRKLYAEYCGLKVLTSINSFITSILKGFMEEVGLTGVELDKKSVEELLRFRLYVAGFYYENSLVDTLIGLGECYLVRTGVVLFE